MRWRIGILYRSIELLELLSHRPHRQEDLMASFRTERFRNVDLTDVLEVCDFNGWANRTDKNELSCTDAGLRLLEQRGSSLRLRMQISSMLVNEDPLWASSSVQGRQAIASYAPPEAVQCFREAGLLDGQDEDVVAWWDCLAAKYRAAQDAVYLEIGRLGERYTVALEESRTGRAPKWIALEFADAGYDVVSCVSNSDTTPLIIEVKTSTQHWNSASFYLSRAEWDILSQKRHAVLHLWSVHRSPAVHASVSLATIERHIPQDIGDGTWCRCRIPFRSISQGTSMSGLDSR